MSALIRFMSGVILALLLAAGAASAQDRTNPVGMRQIEFADGDRRVALAMFYPALHDTVGQLFDCRSSATCICCRTRGQISVQPGGR